jgi:hypothetical protein
MADHTFEELKHKKVVELREIASELEHDAVKGYTQMHKEHLLKAICEALNIDTFDHHVVKDSHKSEFKASIKKYKALRDTALEKKDATGIRDAQNHIRKLKRILRKLAV